MSEGRRAFVTGATGLLGSNLVRCLTADGWHVRALVRSRSRAAAQLDDLPIELVLGDMTDVPAFADRLRGVDVLFHTAAYFRDSYKGGTHWTELHRVNVLGTAALLDTAYGAGVRRMVHVSSIATLDGAPGALINETMRRAEGDADDYYRSKIQSDAAVDQALAAHPDLHATFVLPGWMHGPRDAGPTSAGQWVTDFLRQRLPGNVQSSFSVVDARDVAAAMLAAAEHGLRGERYLAAGRHITMTDLAAALERVSGVAAPRRDLSFGLLTGVAWASELWARLSGRPILLSRASVRLMEREAGRSHYDHRKSEQQLGLRFRPLEETLRDSVAWLRANGLAPSA